MLRTIRQLGITLLITSTWSITSSSSNPVLASARASGSDSSIASTGFLAAIAQLPEDSAPNPPQISPSSNPSLRLQCISGCSPIYPQELAGREGSAKVRVVVDRNGNVVEAQVLEGTAVVEFSMDRNNNVVPKAEGNSIYSQIAQAALAAARQMKFTPPTSGDRTAVLIKINFTMAGTDFNRQTRERSIQNGREREVK